MELGTLLPTYCTDDHAVPPSTIRQWATTADEAGVAGLWVSEHLVQPRTYRTNWLDPFVALGHAAAVTTDVELGTGVLTLPQRMTAKVAHGLASVAYLGEGRPFSVGVGAGYEPREFDAVGVPHDERGPRLSEGLDVLDRLLTGETSFEGAFHDFEDVELDPLPDPQPTYLVAGDSAFIDGERRMTRAVLDRIVDVGGWIAAPEQPEGAASERALIAEHARERGQETDEIRAVLLNYVHLPDPAAEDPRDEQRAVYEQFVDPSGGRGREYVEEHYLFGTTAEILSQLREYEAAGFDQIVLGPPGSSAYGQEGYEQQLERLVETILPEFCG